MQGEVATYVHARSCTMTMPTSKSPMLLALTQLGAFPPGGWVQEFVTRRRSQPTHWLTKRV